MSRGYDFSKGIRGRYSGRKLQFELAPTTRIDHLQDLARELFSEILEMSFDDCLVTDELELRDFLTDEMPDDYEQRFSESYGFDLNAIGGTRIVEILERIAEQRRPPDAVH